MQHINLCMVPKKASTRITICIAENNMLYPNTKTNHKQDQTTQKIMSFSMLQFKTNSRCHFSKPTNLERQIPFVINIIVITLFIEEKAPPSFLFIIRCPLLTICKPGPSLHCPIYHQYVSSFYYYSC